MIALKKGLCLFLSISLALPAWAANEPTKINWSPDHREQVRAEMHTCRSLLAPAEPKVNENVGVLLGQTNNPEEFKAALEQAITDKGRKIIEGGHIFVTGMDLKEEQQIFDGYKEVLTSLDFEIYKNKKSSSKAVRLRVLSLPKEELQFASVKIFGQLWDRFRYFWLSKDRDFQMPTKEEVIGNLVTNGAIEVHTVAFLFTTLTHRIDFAVTIATHLSIILAYGIWQKTFGNWLQRPWAHKGKEINHKRMMKVIDESLVFVKQMFLALPFVVSFNIGANMSKIMAFYREYGYEATMTAFPEQLQLFLSNQSITLFLQSLFYSIVMSSGVQAWVNTISGEVHSRKALHLAPWIRAPFLVVDAIGLAAAGTGAHVLFQLGNVEFNLGQAILLGLTVIGLPIFIKPRILDRTLNIFDYWERFKNKFKKTNQ